MERDGVLCRWHQVQNRPQGQTEANPPDKLGSRPDGVSAGGCGILCGMEQDTPPQSEAREASNTPAPWNLHRCYDGELMAVPEGGGEPAFVAASLVIARGEQIIAEVKMMSGRSGRGFPTVESHAEMKANAAFIIRACNSHAELVNLVANALPFITQHDPEGQWVKDARATLQTAAP